MSPEDPRPNSKYQKYAGLYLRLNGNKLPTLCHPRYTVSGMRTRISLLRSFSDFTCLVRATHTFRMNMNGGMCSMPKHKMDNDADPDGPSRSAQTHGGDLHKSDCFSTAQSHFSSTGGLHRSEGGFSLPRASALLLTTLDRDEEGLSEPLLSVASVQDVMTWYPKSLTTQTDGNGTGSNAPARRRSIEAIRQAFEGTFYGGRCNIDMFEPTPIYDNCTPHLYEENAPQVPFHKSQDLYITAHSIEPPSDKSGGLLYRNIAANEQHDPQVPEEICYPQNVSRMANYSTMLSVFRDHQVLPPPMFKDESSNTFKCQRAHETTETKDYPKALHQVDMFPSESLALLEKKRRRIQHEDESMSNLLITPLILDFIARHGHTEVGVDVIGPSAMGRPALPNVKSIKTAEFQMNRLQALMAQSEQSQTMLRKISHSQTLDNTSRSRRQLQEDQI